MEVLQYLRVAEAGDTNLKDIFYSLFHLELFMSIIFIYLYTGHFGLELNSLTP